MCRHHMYRIRSSFRLYGRALFVVYPSPPSQRKINKKIPCRPARSILCNTIAPLYVFILPMFPSPLFCLPQLLHVAPTTHRPHFNDHYHYHHHHRTQKTFYILVSSSDLLFVVFAGDGAIVCPLALFFTPSLPAPPYPMLFLISLTFCRVLRTHCATVDPLLFCIPPTFPFFLGKNIVNFPLGHF